MSCCCINQREHHLPIYHCRISGNSQMRYHCPNPLVSCHEPLQNTGMLWVEHQGEVIHCDSSCWGIWFPALAPYITEAQGITEICWAQSFHARNWMLMSLAQPCSALGLKLSFRWCSWFLTPALDPRSGHNPMLFQMSYVTPGSAQQSTGVCWRDMRKTTRGLANEHHVPTTVLRELLGRLSQHPYLSQSSWERALVFPQFSKPAITFLRQPHAQLLHEVQASAFLLQWRLAWFFFFPPHLILKIIGFTLILAKYFVALPWKSRVEATHILWKLWHYNM